MYAEPPGRSDRPAKAVGLVATGLSRRFGGRFAVRRVDLQVRPGEVIGLLGPNGAGKTTVFRMIVGALQPDSGSVWLDGVALSGLPLWRRVRLGLGYLPQQPTGFRRLSVADNLRIPILARGGSDALVEQGLKEAGLLDRAQTRFGALSGGERRRLEIARSLAGAPRVLLLDEPFAGVDPVGVEDLQGRIRDLASRGLGVLVTDHAVRETLMICDKALILDSGEVIAQGTPRAVAADARVRSRYLGERFGESWGGKVEQIGKREE